MLKLNLRTHGPSLAKVVAKVHHHVRNIEDAMAGVVHMLVGQFVAIGVVAVEVAAQCNLAISADAEPVSAGMVHDAVSCIHLCIGRHCKSQQ